MLKKLFTLILKSYYLFRSAFYSLEIFKYFYFYLDSLWLHVRASGHWTRRVYDLFRLKLKQEHGGVLNDFNDIRLRSSMRSRMSKSYIDELRGTHQHEFHSQLNEISDCSISQRTSYQPKSVSVSIPSIKTQDKIFCSSCQSTLSLRDIELINSNEKSIIINPQELENINDDIEIKPKPILKNSNRLTVPNITDYCVKIPQISSISNEQNQIEFNETRLSDALGYLRMYKNHNRIQFNSLQFNDREDLQVKQKKI